MASSVSEELARAFVRIVEQLIVVGYHFGIEFNGSFDSNIRFLFNKKFQD